MHIADRQASWCLEGEPPEVYEDPVSMGRDTPTTVETAQLQTDLRRLGLGCEQTEESALTRFIAEVRTRLPNGHTQAAGVGTRDYDLMRGSEPARAFVDHVLRLSADKGSGLADAIAGQDGAEAFFDCILRDNPGGQQVANAMAGAEWGSPDFVATFTQNDPEGIVFLAKLADAHVKLTAATTWKWTRDDETGRRTRSDLTELSVEDRWDRLNRKSVKANRSACRKGQQPGNRWADTGYRYYPYSDDLSSADAIKEHYTAMGTNLSTALVEGLDRSCIEAAIANQLSFLKDESFAKDDFDSRYKDKEGKVRDQEFLLFLVYQPSENDVQGVGVIGVRWRLTVEKFKKKKQKKHPTTMTFWIHTLLYGSVYDSDDSESKRTKLSDQTKEDLKLAG